ncbi:hypothetical protein C8Q77DRAFT_1157195 [Trametes polyzona]|nr:hypothetical protein C8Q77DRAFT_1157195 [Trametes polyzona]
MSALIHPAGKRFLMRKSSNTENMPPSSLTAGLTKKAEALVSAREASRRRRARVVSGSMALRKIVQNAQRRASKAYARPTLVKLEPVSERVAPAAEAQQAPAEEVKVALPTPSSAPSNPILEFPRWLSRPPNFPRPFDRANIDACGDAIHGVPHNYILRGLDVTGHSMWQMVQGAIMETQSHVMTLPKEMKVIIADHTMMAAATGLPVSFPTHVLALWEQNEQGGMDPATGRRKIRLVPVHNLVMAAYCANWFPMRADPTAERKRVVVNAGGAMGTELTLPLVPLAVPHVESFHQLLYLLYTHKISKAWDELVPVQKPTYVLPSRQNPRPQNPHYIIETGKRLAAQYQPWAIVRMLRHVIGLWQNVCYFGISDRRVWVGIDWSWDMLLTGLAHATGQPERVPRPPRPAGLSPSPAAEKAPKQEYSQPPPQYAPTSPTA